MLSQKKQICVRCDHPITHTHIHMSGRCAHEAQSHTHTHTHTHHRGKGSSPRLHLGHERLQGTSGTQQLLLGDGATPLPPGPTHTGRIPSRGPSLQSACEANLNLVLTEAASVCVRIADNRSRATGWTCSMLASGAVMGALMGKPVTERAMSREVLERGGGGGRGSGTQNFVYQKWPDQISSIVNFVFPHYGHLGLGGMEGGPGRGTPPPAMVYGHCNTSMAMGLPLDRTVHVHITAHTHTHTR